VGPNSAVAEYVRAYRPEDETVLRHNRDVSHSFTMAPRIFPPIEMMPLTAGQPSFRWNAVPQKPYTVQWSTNLSNWANIDNVSFNAVETNATYTDTNTTRVNLPKSFYRVSYTP
jgi:hypothetical protein